MTALWKTHAPLTAVSLLMALLGRLAPTPERKT